ncbi:hypothetical protein [Erythrobacter sp.]|uniref:hypothetical protein n=1 Tax=Erythrobacter sp. TaxID=1042 RepID=UPI001B1BB638|nr:hypothetical protein [Erythrobacter sp.]MBO6527645.1 hypothetical protein [Erythrobacter sp.]MBO6530100.1 hypothetical protein [Erythrobacter sp.]
MERVFEREMTAAKRTAPISSHPAFKWGVGAWFALLLGLGLFVMPAGVHQLLAERLGLAGILPGESATRLVLSMGAALLGLMIGLVLAMRVAAINEASDESDDEEAAETAGVWLQDDKEEPRPADTGADAPRRPFNPREDLPEEGIGSFEGSARGGLTARDADTEEAVLEEVESVPDDPYFAEQWEEPIHETEAADAWEDTQEPASPVEEPAVQTSPDTEAESSHSETVEAEVEETLEPESAANTPPPAALGDLSLEELTQRLGTALDALKAGPPENGDADPVIAFLRREAEREAPDRGSGSGSGDPQADLRSALDKLSRVGKPK